MKFAIFLQNYFPYGGLQRDAVRLAEAAVVAVPDDKWGERPLAFVVFHEGKKADDAELLEHLRPGFAKWALPDRFVEIDQIPRTSTGKFAKRVLREKHLPVPS